MTFEELEASLEGHGWVRLDDTVSTHSPSVAGLEAERITTEPCGCRVDRPTGLRTWFCPYHEQEEHG